MTSTSDNRPQVSVVIPVFNGERFLADAIESVLVQLGEDDEIIVVDDGSTDGTVAVAEGFSRVRLICQANAGPAAARNAAIVVASGTYIAPIDHDDLWPVGRLQAMVSALEQHPDAPYVVGTQQLEVLPGAALPYWLASTDQSDLDRSRTERGTGLMLMRRSAFDTVGLFDETMRAGGEDIDWVFRCVDLGLTEVVIEDTVLIRRMHGQNFTMDRTLMDQSMFDILRRRAHRRRSQ